MKHQFIKQHFSAEELLSGDFGIEREGLRVTASGKLALTPHPEIFGDKLKNPYYTTDFSESQVEVVTPTYPSVKQAYEVLSGMVDSVHNELATDEYFWPQSMPCDLPEDETIPIAIYDETCAAGREARAYREGLKARYGGKRQMISGIHFNFSFTDAFIDKLHGVLAPQLSRKDFKDSIYLKLVRNFLRYRWLIIYLTGCTSALHDTYLPECVAQMKPVGRESNVLETGISFRNSGCGYKNEAPLFAGYASVKEYVEDVRRFVADGLLSAPKEHYTQIRLKAADVTDVLGSLLSEGIKYLEIRTMDLNVFDKAGVAEIDLDFCHRFLVFLLFKEESDYPDWQQEAMGNEDTVATAGLKPDVTLRQNGEFRDQSEWALELLDEMSAFDDTLNLGGREIIDVMRRRVMEPERTYAHRLVDLVEKEGYLNGQMFLAKQYKEESYSSRYLLRGFTAYELSTQILIKEAMTRGVKVTELDPQDNFIGLARGDVRTMVKQATKTERDNYASVLAMENKVVTKKILAAKGVPVPGGEEFYSIEEAAAKVSSYIDIPVVIKPKSTNFGLGISIFDKGGSREDLLSACRIGFEYDNTILIEDYITGQEYRFLVIDGRVEAVLKRVAANVIGDGKRSIQELVAEKNTHPFRGEGYTAPLKKIKMDEQTLLFLKGQQLKPESIVHKGTQVFLRGNSNISTGGDSIDFTDEMPAVFKKVAIDAAQAVGAVFCGVDILIDDYRDDRSSYGIIELNFNPSTDMHAYPLFGKERRTGEMILRALKLI